MKIIEDLSYHNLGKMVQKNEANAKGLLIELAKEMAVLDPGIAELEDKLTELRVRRKEVIKASQVICGMVEKQLPLAVVMESALVVVTETGVTIETNIL